MVATLEGQGVTAAATVDIVGATSKEDTSLTNASEDDQDGVEFCPLPPRQRRKRGDSHVSDITEDSFYRTRRSLERMGLGNINTMEVLRILHEEESYGLTVPRLVSSTPQPQTLPGGELYVLYTGMDACGRG